MTALVQTEVRSERLIAPLPAVITTEEAGHADAIETLVDMAFGPDRLRKTSYRLREGLAPIAELGLVALEGADLVGTIRFWEIRIPNGAKTLLLGPLAIHPERQGRGVGRTLMTQGIGKARELGWEAVLLVGDEPYYRRFGFVRALAEGLTLPGPVDPNRFLGLELVFRSLQGVEGMVERAEG